MLLCRHMSRTRMETFGDPSFQGFQSRTLVSSSTTAIRNAFIYFHSTQQCCALIQAPSSGCPLWEAYM